MSPTYLFIACVIVGSILSMDRRTLITGIVKIFIPLAAGSVLDWDSLWIKRSPHLFFIIVPIMAGGIGEGAIPLTLGYVDILNLPQNQLFAQIVPAIVLGNLMAIICASLLNQLGKRRPHYTGQGRLYAADEAAPVKPAKAPTVTVEHIAAAGMIAITFYILGILVHKLTGLPAPVGMLFLVVLAKLTYAVSPKLEDGARTVYHFFLQQ